MQTQQYKVVRVPGLVDDEGVAQDCVIDVADRVIFLDAGMSDHRRMRALAEASRLLARRRERMASAQSA